ncbi:MAG: hypothetical protein ABFD50_07915 [Smithella sp.]
MKLTNEQIWEYMRYRTSSFNPAPSWMEPGVDYINPLLKELIELREGEILYTVGGRLKGMETYLGFKTLMEVYDYLLTDNNFTAISLKFIKNESVSEFVSTQDVSVRYYVKSLLMDMEIKNNALDA